MASHLSWGPSPDSVSIATSHDSRPTTSQGHHSSMISNSATMDDHLPGWPPVQGVSAIDQMLDQHTAALDSLNMDANPSSFPLTSSYVLSQHYLSDLDSDANLNPNEEYLNNLNRDRFLSITAFYRLFIKRKDDLLGLEDFPMSPVITREDLRGDECDMQGINWAVRKTTRDGVRKKRLAFENGRLSPQLQAVRKVHSH